MITDETILQIFINQNQKIMSARLNSQKFLTSATVDYILNRTSFLPTEYTIRERIIVIKNGWQEHPKCIVCGENTKFTGGSFTRFCSYSCSNKNTARARVSKMNTVKNNTNLFIEGFTEGKGIIDVCRENNINYKRARGFLHQLGIEAPSKFRNNGYLRIWDCGNKVLSMVDKVSPPIFFITTIKQNIISSILHNLKLCFIW
jgi:predicted nucleic acid-binding Zn ribbon protein